MMGNFLAALVEIYTLVLLGRIIFSWLPPQSRQNQFYEFLYQITEPVLKPFRRLIPPIKGFDLSPILLFRVLRLLAEALSGI